MRRGITYRTFGALLLLALCSCERPGAEPWKPGTGGPVPGVDYGATPEEVAEEIGMPTSTRTESFISVQEVDSMTRTLETYIYMETTKMPRGSTLRVRIDTWKDVQRWPWQNSRTWEVAYRRVDRQWRTFASFDKNDDVVIG